MICSNCKREGRGNITMDEFPQGWRCCVCGYEVRK